MLTFSQHKKSSLVVQTDLTASANYVAVSAVAEHRFAILAENLAHTLAKTLYEVSTGSSEFPQNLEVLSDRDLGQIRLWNTTLPTGVNRCVHDLIVEVARYQPRAPALAAWDGDLTYGQMELLTNQLALLLHNEGARPNTIVALCFEKSKWTTVAMLGTLRAGAAFVLLDTAFPLQRATAMVKHVDAKILLASSTVLPGLKAQFSSVITVDGDLFRHLPSPTWSYVCEATPEDLAVVLFTSGSTGTPKAILQDHIAASTTADGLGHAWGLTPKSRILQFAAYAFDMSVIDTLMALVNGACLCVPTQEEVMSNPRAAIQRMQVNFSAVTPSVATAYPPEIDDTLQTLVLGGEKVPRALIEFWTKRLTVFNGYGPAEASVCALGQADAIRPMSLGKPINTLAWVVDEENHNILKPIGAVGELLLEGPMLAKGYLGDLEKTRSCFIDNPEFLNLGFGLAQGVVRRAYKSGDLVRQYPDGSLDYLGRKDLQVKLRGQRIELSEIEHHLQMLLSKDSPCFVDMIDFDTGPALAAFIGNAPTGYVAPRNGEENRVKEQKPEASAMSLLSKALEERLRESLEATLPAYMVPSVFLSLREIPMTVSQKIDRTALKRLGWEACLRQRSTKSSTARGSRSENDAEDYLRRQWGEILGLTWESISGDSNFLDLGGHSLLAMRLASRLQSRWPASRISVRDVFENPTLQMQAGLITMRKSNGNNSLPPSIQSIPNDPRHRQLMSLETGFDEMEIEDVMEATDFQSEVISSEITSDESEVHHCTFSFSPAIETGRMEHAIQAFANHYSIFRTCFVVLKGKLFQLVLKSAPRSLVRSVDDECTVHSPHNNGGLTECEVGPRRRALYLQYFMIQSTGPSTSSMTLRISHALFDGGYDGGFLRRATLELRALYQGETLSRSPPFSAFCSARLSNLSAGITFWEELLKNAEPSRLTIKRGPSNMRLISSEVVRSVHIQTMPQGATPATLMKSAWALVLSEILHTRDVVFGSIASGRFSFSGADMTMGPCINTIPVRVLIEDNVTTSKFLSKVQDQYLAAIPFESVGLQTIVQKCTNWPSWEDLSTVVNDLSEENFLDQLDEKIPFNGGICSASVCQNPGKWTDIAVETKKEGDQMHARLYFCSEVFPTGLVEDLGNMLVANIKMLSSGPDRLVSRQKSGQVLSSTDLPLPPAGSSPVMLTSRPSKKSVSECVIVQEAWRSVFRSDVLKTSTTSEPDKRPFYDSWPLVCAYGLYKFYSEKGFAVTVDDIIHHPSAENQRWLLAQRSQDRLHDTVLSLANGSIQRGHES
jgi:amino acid adenylation domain-containing protein